MRERVALLLIVTICVAIHLCSAAALPSALPERRTPATSASPQTKVVERVAAQEPPANGDAVLQSGGERESASKAVVAKAAAQPADGSSQTEAVAAALGPGACEAGGMCAALGEAVVGAAEGAECRTLHVTGKCTAKCLEALKEALANKMWNACAARCETDVVAGAAARWTEMCEARQPTLLDQGKQAALKLVRSPPNAGWVIRAVAVAALFAAAVLLGYRRGVLQGHALWLQRSIKKQSERNIV